MLTVLYHYSAGQVTDSVDAAEEPQEEGEVEDGDVVGADLHPVLMTWMLN